MFKVSKQTHFDAAHRLPKHGGKCRNLHGHRWVVTFHARADELNDQGMVRDFGAFRVLQNRIDREFDHSLLIGPGDEELGKVAVDLATKVVFLTTDSTAENLAAMFYNMAFDEGIPVSRVDVEESPGSMASYGHTDL